MKKRSPAAVLLLPFVTLGIYCIYWLYATRKELTARTGNKYSIPPVSLLFAGFIVLIALIIAMFAISATSSHGDGFGVVSIVTFILGMFSVIGIIAIPLWWFWHYCQTAANQTQTMDFTQMYVLHVVLSWVCSLMPVWMLIMQLEYNKVADREAAHPHHPEHHEHAEHHHPTHHTPAGA